MTITSPYLDAKQDNLGIYAVVVLLAAFVGVLAYIAFGGSPSAVDPIEGRTSAVEPIFTEEWIAARNAIGQPRTEPIFTEEWIAARNAIGQPRTEPIFTEEWIAARNAIGQPRTEPVHQP